VALTLVLVAALAPGARADTDDGGGMPSSPETLTPTFQAEPAVSPEGTGDGSSDTVVLAEGGQTSGAEHASTGSEELQDPAPLKVTEHHQEGQPPGEEQHAAATDGPLDEAEQLAQRFDTDQACGADGSCQEEPGIPRVPLIRGETGETGPGEDQPRDRSADRSPEEEAFRESIFEQQAQIDSLRYDITIMRRFLQNVRSPETRAEKTAALQEDIGHPIEDRSFQERIDRIRYNLDQLTANLPPGMTPESAALHELVEAQAHLRELSRRVERGVVPRGRGESPPSGGESAMNAVQPEEVGPRQPTTEGNQAVIPKPAGFGGNQPEIPNQTVFTPPDAATKKLVTENLGHTPPQIDTSIPPTRVTELGYIGGGLAVLLAALLAVGCKGAPCSSMLRPAFRGFQGVPGQGVPGHLQG